MGVTLAGSKTFEKRLRQPVHGLRVAMYIASFEQEVGN